MAARRGMLTSPDGPVLIGARTLRALDVIKKLGLLEKLYGRVVVARSVFEAVKAELRGVPPWLVVVEDQPKQQLPTRIAHADPLDAATLRLAIALPASMVLIDGPIKEPAKLSLIKCEGTVAVLVEAYRQGHLGAVEPMLKALEALGHGGVLPPPDLLDALRKALREL